MFDTIAAISSGSKINQPISIIRISGPDSVNIMKKIFKGKIGEDKTITFGNIVNNNQEVLDEVLVMWFIGVKKGLEIEYKNYVGEELVEINCHGGIVVTNSILELILSSGARLALPGEFTRRAFLNGKMDLVKAEAIHDLIMAKSQKQAHMSVNKFTGKTSDLLSKFLDKLNYLIGLCEVNIDYPEYDDVEQLDQEIMLKSIENLATEISEVLEISKRSQKIFEGIKVAILGKPNVGKSSLLNALVSENKAIVTDIAGTTRDLIETSYQLDGILFTLVDTAGLRKSDELIEQIGIKKSLEQIKKADLILHVIDPLNNEDEFDLKIEQESKKENKTYIKIINKKDLIIGEKVKSDLVLTSALNNDIIDLEKEIISKYSNINLDDERILNNTRQISLIEEAKNNLNNAIKSLNLGLTFDVIIVDIYNAWEKISEIKGNVNKEDLLDSMFKNFCLGK
ncbi:tRNA uridine-5-carboxymethylaminomethyl(34) synthesis GTPase MnmE [Mycoplasmopsis alligatoris]|uniref:tRNA modification GTPase MnmE n=1 Tax=Mycoplasmopsis alligatoris A21JP2 TaxID=747682 RepID=D4XWH0_9BACT|nr:tRNA uridine-5-carboxymethylaminomethyl(34) synthesis GTPase MnmE [Mycoplasmopsis alligatoris]EFF41327.1 tRNA modification GTPase TrmE [Mycoplasmopsis alligatoris A21JP2]